MKKMLLAGMLLVGTIQGAQKGENLLPLLAHDNVRIFGQNSSFVDISQELASTIPVIAKQTSKKNHSVCLSNTDEFDLAILKEYATLREGARTDPQYGSSLQEVVRKLPLETLSRQTILIGTLYGEQIPRGFDGAWEYQFNECNVGRGTVEDLIGNGEIVNFICEAFQDQQTIKGRSSHLDASHFAETSDGQQTIYPTLEERQQRAQQKKWQLEDAPLPQPLPFDQGSKAIELDSEKQQNNSDQSNSEKGLSQFFSGISAFCEKYEPSLWKQCGSLEKCTHVGLGLFLIFATYKLWQRG